MSNHVMLVGPADPAELNAELIAAGVTAGVGIDNEKVMLNGTVWDDMDNAAQTAELALVTTAVAARPVTSCI